MTTSEQFIEAWMSSDSLQEVADKLNIQRFSVYARAQEWRKRGVKLPKLREERATGNKLDVSDLNNLIAEYK